MYAREIDLEALIEGTGRRSMAKALELSATIGKCRRPSVSVVDLREGRTGLWSDGGDGIEVGRRASKFERVSSVHGFVNLTRIELSMVALVAFVPSAVFSCSRS
jgi:hypothetical protein